MLIKMLHMNSLNSLKWFYCSSKCHRESLDVMRIRSCAMRSITQNILSQSTFPVTLETDGWFYNPITHFPITMKRIYMDRNNVRISYLSLVWRVVRFEILRTLSLSLWISLSQFLRDRPHPLLLPILKSDSPLRPHSYTCPPTHSANHSMFGINPPPFLFPLTPYLTPPQLRKEHRCKVSKAYPFILYILTLGIVSRAVDWQEWSIHSP